MQIRKQMGLMTDTLKLRTPITNDRNNVESKLAGSSHWIECSLVAKVLVENCLERQIVTLINFFHFLITHIYFTDSCQQ